ncbi:MAG: glycoside hydrolase family 95 protein [Panacibacter sp.]
MIKRIVLVVFFANTLHSLFAQYADKLWYNKPATLWTEALPVGNGRLGAMVFGNVTEELIQLNESSLWSGGPVKTNVNPDAPKYLPLIREALFSGRYDTAIAITKKMQGLFTESYMPLGDVVIKQKFKDTVASEYYRDLNIKDAIATTTFTIAGTTFTREIFSSAPDQVIIIKLTASKKAALNFTVSAKSLLLYHLEAAGSNELLMKGKAPAHVDPSYYNVHKEPVVYEDTTGCNGMRFEMALKAISKDGSVRTDTTGIHVSNATEVTVFLSAATSFNGFDKCPDKEGRDEHQLAQQYLKNAAKKSFEILLKNHLADYHQYFDRVSFILNDTAVVSTVSLPSDQRLLAYSNGAYDPGIESLYFDFGRYLLISSSRPGGLPANLQGVWNKELRPPWSSNFTININTQMNYWPAEVTNLSEMHEPLFQLIKELSVTGKTTAKEFYNMNGWVAHHNTDIWALSNPVGDKGWGDPRWANWAQGGNWLCQDLWEHYSFTHNKKFLQDTAYPIIKGAAIFCLDWLVEDKDGYLVVAPSVSPENVFSYAKDKVSDVSIATTMDMSIIWDLFTNLIEASTILNIDKDFRDQLIAKKSKLFPLHIGAKGNLQEWYKDYDDVEVHHRHVSHLFGLHPGRQISPVLTPGFANAAKKTLEIRGDDGTGWSKAWKINFWARLLDGNHAYLLLRQLLNATGEVGYNYAHGGGTYPNFFDAHPPFQIDGNFGGTAGIAEMLLQSHLGEIHLLPALPDAWKEGEIKGLKARGNFEISISWKNHQLTNAKVVALSGGICKIRTAVPVKIAGIGTVSLASGNSYVVIITAQKGKTYNIIPL